MSKVHATPIGDGCYSFLSPAECKELRKACKYAKLPFPAMAARPEAARELIQKVAADIAQHEQDPNVMQWFNHGRPYVL